VLTGSVSGVRPLGGDVALFGVDPEMDEGLVVPLRDILHVAPDEA
jgi:hypothetical protein